MNEVWEEFPIAFFQALYNSYNKRLAEVIQLKGAHTHY
jgi:hypothetical protein